MGRPRAGDEHGAVLVEAALVMPVLLLILFGILEFGLVFKDSLSVSSATRSGARAAVARSRDSEYLAQATGAVTADLAAALPAGSLQFLTVYKADTDGTPVEGDYSTCTTCVRFRWDGTRWVGIGGTWSHLSQYACGGVLDTDHLGVWVQARHASVSGFFPGRTIRERTVMRLEPVPRQQRCKPT